VLLSRAEDIQTAPTEERTPDFDNVGVRVSNVYSEHHSKVYGALVHTQPQPRNP
jgi:hypothetical protein